MSLLMGNNRLINDLARTSERRNRRCDGLMASILDGLGLEGSVLDGLDDWPRSATRKEWFRITRQLIQQTIAHMDLEPVALAEVEEAFISAGLL